MKYKNKARLSAALLAAALLLAILAGCGAAPADDEGGSLQIVTTIFPVYDWTRAILGGEADGVSLTMLLDSGVDLHSFQPTAADIMRIAGCDLFICVGGESDFWVDDALQEAVNKDMVVLDLMDLLGDRAREEELVEGMEAPDGEEEEEEDGPEYDEHIWLSLKNAAFLCGKIAEALEALDPANAARYEANAADYIEKLTALDAAYEAAVRGGTYDTLLFGDRFPFRYLTEDYGLTYYAAFLGCSAETEASFETVLYLAGKVDELGLPCVMTIEGSDGRIAETIIRNTKTQDQAILALDSMQSVTAKDVSEGADYLSIMEKNLSILKQALGGGEA